MTPALSPSLPRALQIEVTGACNLACAMCLVRYRPKLGRRSGSMCFHVFRRIVDELPELESITLQGLGEPLLAPDLFRMIEYAAAHGIRTGFNTNGILLTRDRSERLVAAGLAWLHVSLDGATAATYESIRDGADFEVVARNVRTLVEVVERGSTGRPRLSLVFVAMRRNLHELPALVRLAAEWGVGRLWVQSLSHSFADTDPAGDYRGIREFAEAEALWRRPGEDAEAAFRQAGEDAERLGVELRLPRLDERPPERRAPGEPGCEWPWRSAYVTHRGRVQPCCMVMGADRAVLGNVATDAFPAVWTNDAYSEFRSALLGTEPPQVCRGCAAYRGVF